jgi:hypothetical protein
LRDYCPNCGKPTAWGERKERLESGGSPGGRPLEELKRNRKTVLIACAAIAGFLAISGRVHLAPLAHLASLPPIHINVNEAPKGPVVTNAVELVGAYAANPDAADKRFGGREIQVSGEFLRIVPDGYGSIDMRLKTANPEAPLGVDLVNEAVDDAKHLTPGQQVTVSCRRVAHTGDEHWLQNCAIQPEANAPAAPPKPLASPAPPAPSPPPAPGQGNSG